MTLKTNDAAVFYVLSIGSNLVMTHFNDQTSTQADAAIASFMSKRKALGINVPQVYVCFRIYGEHMRSTPPMQGSPVPGHIKMYSCLREYVTYGSELCLKGGVIQSIERLRRELAEHETVGHWNQSAITAKSQTLESLVMRAVLELNTWEEFCFAAHNNADSFAKVLSEEFAALRMRIVGMASV